MGGVVGSIVGAVSSSDASKKAAKINAQAQADNRAFAQNIYDTNTALFKPNTSLGDSADSYIGQMLGLSTPTSAGTQAFQNYHNSSGYQYLVNQAMNGVSNNAAAAGQFGSGATAKALQTRAMNLADTSQQEYLNNLTGVANRGMTSKAAIAGAGDTLSNQTIAANNSQAQSSMQNAISQGNIVNGLMSNLQSSLSMIPMGG